MPDLAEMAQLSVLQRELVLNSMLGDDQGRRLQCELLEASLIFAWLVIRRIEKYDVARLLGHQFGRSSDEHGRSIARIQAFEIRSNHGCRCPAALDEDAVSCATAQRFDTYSSSSRIRIDEDGAFDSRHQDTKEGFAEPVWCWPGCKTRKALENAASELACDHSHRLPHIDEAIASLPVALNVSYRRAHLVRRRWMLDERHRFVAGRSQNIEVPHDVCHCQSGYA